MITERGYLNHLSWYSAGDVILICGPACLPHNEPQLPTSSGPLVAVQSMRTCKPRRLT